MVVRLAESLEVPLRERNALLLAAGYAPAHEETRFDDPKLDPIRTALEQVLKGHRTSQGGTTSDSAQMTANSNSSPR